METILVHKVAGAVLLQRMRVYLLKVLPWEARPLRQRRDVEAGRCGGRGERRGRGRREARVGDVVDGLGAVRGSRRVVDLLCRLQASPPRSEAGVWVSALRTLSRSSELKKTLGGVLNVSCLNISTREV
ncbi:unnamed protein product [Urochloa humidicola]